MDALEKPPIRGALEQLPPMFDSATLASWLGQTVKWIHTMRSNGRGPAYIKPIGGRSVLYCRDDVVRWIEESRHNPACRQKQSL
jgi:hypothetical protein